MKCGSCPFCLSHSDFKFHCTLSSEHVVVITEGGRPTENAEWCKKEYFDIDMHQLHKDIKGW